jgi:hypothetical protein
LILSLFNSSRIESTAALSAAILSFFQLNKKKQELLLMLH